MLYCKMEEGIFAEIVRGKVKHGGSFFRSAACHGLAERLRFSFFRIALMPKPP